MKKHKLFAFGLAALFGVSCFAACAEKTSPEPDGGDGNDNTVENNEPAEGGDLTLDVPEKEEIVPLPGEVPMPAKPDLPAADAAKAPYIGRVGSSTDAYTVTGDTENGWSVSYGTGKPLEDYHFLYFDVYNYSSSYGNIRFDFVDVLGAEKVAVSAMYLEAFDAKVPPVGVLVESLMDGEMSYVTHLKNFRTVNKNYEQQSGNLIDQTVCRLIVYLDSNPSQKPTDRVGSLKIGAISFLKDDDPLNNVDNSPKIGETAAAGGYNVTTPEGKVFQASYTASGLTEGAAVTVTVNRWTGAYGRVKLGYTANGAQKLSVADGAGNQLLTNETLSSAGELTLDLRDLAPALRELRFVIDGNGQDTASRTFTLESVQFIYTPYASDTWSSTSKYTIGAHGLGGKVVAYYDETVGWERLSVQVKYWTPEYSRMVAKFKTTGNGGQGAEKIGLTVNSKDTILELQYNAVADLEYDSATQEYTVVADLSSVGKLSALDFYFDSLPDTHFAGTRSVQFLSIEFEKGSDVPTVGKLHNSYSPGGYTIEQSGSETTVSWDENRPEWDYVQIKVSGYRDEFAYLHIVLETEKDFKLSVGYNGSPDWLDKGQMTAGQNELYLIPVSPAREKASFDLNFYFNGGEKNTTGSVTFKTIEFLKERPALGYFHYDGMFSNTSSGHPFTFEKSGGSTTVIWGADRNQYEIVLVPVHEFTSEYKYLKFTLNGQSAFKLGVYIRDPQNPTGEPIWAWGHSEVEAGEQVIYAQIPSSVGAEDFMLQLYFDKDMQAPGGVSQGNRVSVKIEATATNS